MWGGEGSERAQGRGSGWGQKVPSLALADTPWLVKLGQGPFL